jgi:hypothetical protein
MNWSVSLCFLLLESYILNGRIKTDVKRVKFGMALFIAQTENVTNIIGRTIESG